MADEPWQPAEQVQKNSKGEYRAMIGGQWVPVQKAQKNSTGQYRVIPIASNTPTEKEPVVEPQSQPSIGTRLLSLAAPGGLARLTSQAQQDYDKAAYNVGGGVTDVASKVPALRGAPAAALGTAANVGIQALPMMIGGEAGKVIKPELEGSGRWFMKSALKPPIGDQLSGDAAKAIETMLKRGYSPTQSGVDAMQKQISKLGDEVKNAIASSTATVDKNAVASRLQVALDRFKSQVNPKADTAAVEKAWTEFLTHPDLAGKARMPVQLAHELKQGTYRALGDKPYGELSGAATEAQKQLARGLKEEVSAAVPSVAKTNELQAELINAKNIAERRALMEGNKNPISLGAGLGFAAHNPLATLGMWANSSATVKALIARMLYSGAERLPDTAGKALGAYIGAQSGKPPESPEALARLIKEKLGEQ